MPLSTMITRGASVDAVPLRTTVADVLGDTLVPELGAGMLRRTIELADHSTLVIRISRRHDERENEWRSTSRRRKATTRPERDDHADKATHRQIDEAPIAGLRRGTAVADKVRHGNHGHAMNRFHFAVVPYCIQSLWLGDDLDFPTDSAFPLHPSRSCRIAESKP